MRRLGEGMGNGGRGVGRVMTVLGLREQVGVPVSGLDLLDEHEERKSRHGGPGNGGGPQRAPGKRHAAVDQQPHGGCRRGYHTHRIGERAHRRSDSRSQPVAVPQEGEERDGAQGEKGEREDAVLIGETG
jgi:hypothetical protein